MFAQDNGPIRRRAISTTPLPKIVVSSRWHDDAGASATMKMASMSTKYFYIVVTLQNNSLLLHLNSSSHDIAT